MQGREIKAAHSKKERIKEEPKRREARARFFPVGEPVGNQMIIRLRRSEGFFPAWEPVRSRSSHV